MKKRVFAFALLLLACCLLLSACGAVSDLAAKNRLEEFEKTVAEQTVTNSTDPVTELPEKNVPETGAPETEPPERNIPETDAPVTGTAEKSSPEAAAPETDAAEAEVPETNTPETSPAETDTPEPASAAAQSPDAGEGNQRSLTDAGEAQAGQPSSAERDSSETLRAPDPAPEKASPELEYVCNTNTKKFHFPECSSVRDIKDKNRKDFTGSREELIAAGYAPCKRCNP